MRAAFFVLMMVLLPIRAWVGDAMVIQTASISTSPALAGVKVNSGSSLTPLPCHEAATVSAHTTDLTEPPAVAGDSASAHGDCAQCSTCQMCHSVALFTAIDCWSALVLPRLEVRSSLSLFVSVPLAQHLKPPIS